VASTLLHWGCDALEHLATLLVSELVANVVLHAGTEVEVVVRRAGGRIRLEVHDGDARLPVRKWYSATSTTGRGLALIEELAHRWGAQATSSGKMVWCELNEDDASALATSLADELDPEGVGETAARPPAGHPGRTGEATGAGPRPAEARRTRALVGAP